MEQADYQLIITIVNKGMAKKVVQSSEKAGAVGGTIINGRGASTGKSAQIFGIPIEPEKEIILTVVDKNNAEQVIERIEKDANIDEQGKGVSFMLDVEKVVGIAENNKKD